jgi:V/A-type H+/Na+-transporting ATPase subunit D
MPHNTPPGRAGRRTLRDRLDSAQRAAQLLDRKLRILRHEQDRLASLADRARQVWEYRVGEARTWHDRAVLLCGEDELRLSTVEGQADVDVTWDTLMGIRYPAAAACHLPELGAATHSPGGAALAQARYAYRAALEAAVGYAAALAATNAVDAEIAQTHRTVRGIRTGRVPWLETALRTLTLRIDEAELADLVRLRWAVRAGPSPTGTPSPHRTS